MTSQEILKAYQDFTILIPEKEKKRRSRFFKKFSGGLLLYFSELERSGRRYFV